MAANDYYNTHPSNSASYLHPNLAQSTTYDQYRQTSTSPIPMPSPDASSQHLSLNPSSSPYFSTSAPNSIHSPTPELSGYTSDTSNDRGLFSSSSSDGPKKSKSERAIKFVEKQVKKQIEKKLNGHGGGGHGQQFEEHMNQAFGEQGQSGGEQGAAAGDYGYGNAGGEYGFGNSGGGGAGEYGFGESTGYGPPEGDFGGGMDTGNFEFSGGDGGWLEDLGLGDLGDVGA